MPDFPNPAVASSAILSGSQEADPLIQLLTTTYGMDPAKASAYAEEITAGRAQGAKAYTDEADAIAARRAEERAAEFKTYSDLYAMRAAGQPISPQGEQFMARVAAEHRARMSKDAAALAKRSSDVKYANTFIAPNVLTQIKHGAGKGLAPEAQAEAAGDREINRMANMSTYAKDMKPGANGSPWIPQNNFQELAPNPLVGRPAFDGAAALKALGYDEASRRVDPNAPRAIVLSRDPGRVSGQGLDPVVPAPNLPVPPAPPSMGEEAAAQLLRALGIGQ